ncbi:Lactose transport system permease protein LacF [compost metagenome]
MRSIDDDIWRASKVDGIPTWRTYLFIVLPILRPVLVTAFVMVSTRFVATFDLVFVMTKGGPGLSSQFPALYVYEFMFLSNLGQGLAAASVMFLAAAVIIIPWAYYEFRPKQR